MIKYCLDKWNEHKDKLEAALRKDTKLNDCDYTYLVELVVKYILNGESAGKSDYAYDGWDHKKITTIDNGDYQGTILWLIPMKTYQPEEYEYLMTYCGYGSCSGCDTLKSIQNWDEKPPTKTQLKDYMALCKDLVCNMIKPYNCGWREEEEFKPMKG